LVTSPDVVSKKREVERKTQDGRDDVMIMMM
jgi:hypothetical protein